MSTTLEEFWDEVYPHNNTVIAEPSAILDCFSNDEGAPFEAFDSEVICSF
jgi:hypothetical protein